jgi:hypothetical protein
MAQAISGSPNPDDIAAVTHVIQTALTPVFLLSGVGTLLNMFNTRLARVSDHTEHLTELVDAEQDEARFAQLLRHLRRLRRRRVALDVSIVLGALGGASTCAAAFTLFLGGLRESQEVVGLVILFGAALACTVGALVAFLADSVLAWHGLRVDGPMPRVRSH